MFWLPLFLVISSSSNIESIENHLQTWSFAPTEGNLTKISRKRRALAFPRGSKLTFEPKIEIPVIDMSGTKIDVKFSVPSSFDLPNRHSWSSLGRSLQIEEDHFSIFQVIEEILAK